MANLHVRNIPEELYERICREAQEKNRSLSAQIILLLERAVYENPNVQDEILENIRSRRSFCLEQTGAPDSLSLLHQDRSR